MNFRFSILLTAFFGFSLRPLPAAGPVRVFVLAGQSNMEGQAVVDLTGKDYNGGRGTLVELLRDPVKGPRFGHLRDAEGKWAVREDVFVRYRRERGPLLEGPLGLGFSVYGDQHHFGPELAFGHVVGNHLREPVWLIKTAWGGKSLFKDFRPPGAGGTTGVYYHKMLTEIREGLAAARAAGGDSARPPELSGFVWYHGWNDGVEPERAVPEYEANLGHLIRSLRRDLGVPQLPVVVGELTGPWVEAPPEWTRLREAQAAVARRPEFAGSVRFVKTRDFVRAAADSPNPGHGHHEFGNAETCLLAGEAMGLGMVDLLVQGSAEEPVRRGVAGWTVHVHPVLLAREGEATETALQLLRQQLEEIAGRLPASAVARLKEVPLWFSPAYPGTAGRAEYHPDAGWLRRNGRNPSMAKAVEFSNIPDFSREMERMPNFALHELAHAWHDRVLTFAHPEILQAFGHARDSGKYNRVARHHGQGRPETQERAYAMTDAKEYFAEGTEAWFSRNDYFPFTREDLQAHDPGLAALLGRLWGAAP